MRVKKKRGKVKHDRVYTCLYSCTGHMGGGGEDRKEGDKREKKRQKEIEKKTKKEIQESKGKARKWSIIHQSIKPLRKQKPKKKNHKRRTHKRRVLARNETKEDKRINENRGQNYSKQPTTVDSSP